MAKLSGYKLITTNSIHSARYTSTLAYLADSFSEDLVPRLSETLMLYM